mmetsp:Transcript_85911/g.270790  ORF Transcript_85911/g.270790 Transcript_85911/m.270790 type:complete len:234 (-) Transcript_85911:2-703(-)
MEAHLCSVQVGLGGEEAPVGAGDIPLHNVFVGLLGDLQLQETPPALLQVGLQVPVVDQVVPHGVHDVEVHVASELCDRAVRGVCPCDLVCRLPHLAAVRLDHRVVHMRQTSDARLRQLHETRTERVYAPHEGLHLLVDVLHRDIKHAEVSHDALKDRVHRHALEPLLLEHIPLRPDLPDLLLDHVHVAEACPVTSSLSISRAPLPRRTTCRHPRPRKQQAPELLGCLSRTDQA